MKFIFVITTVFLFSLTAFGQNIGPMFTTDAQIYLQRFGAAPNGAADLGVRPVERVVPRHRLLFHTLLSLFDEEEISDEEVEAGFSSSTFGMKLEGVTLRNGTATVSFSQPDIKTKYGLLEPMIFTEAVTKTARQFSSVKRVKICAVGKTTIDAEFEEPFPRCSRGR